MEYLVTEANVKLLGRTTYENQIRYLSYSCSGIEFEVTGTKVEAVLWSDGDNWTPELRAWMAVFIDDEVVPSKRFCLDQEEGSYVLFESAEEKHVKVTLLKYSEAAFAKVGIKKLKIQGSTPIPTPQKALKIEFIGDSITCGYGDEGQFEVDTFTTAQENPYLAYAAQTAVRLQADYHLVAWSGIGILSSWTPEDKINRREQMMPKLYPYTNLALSSITGTKPLWDFSAFQPDVVVICLGQNDASYTRGKPEREAAFEAVYYQFLWMVRMYHPNAKIICTLGGMGGELYPQIEKAVESYKENERDANIFSFALSNMTESEGIGTDSHPTLKTHQKMTNELVHYLQQIL